MHIDAHQHFWRYDPREYGWIDDSLAWLRRDFLPSDLEPELKRNGSQGWVAAQARQTLEETRWLLDLASRAPFVLGVVGWVDLKSPRLRSQLESLTVNSKLVGVRHVVQSEPDDQFLLHPEFLRGITMLADFGLAYDILIYPRHLGVAVEFARRFPEQHFVLDHLAKPQIKDGQMGGWAAGIQELASFPNVPCKLSGLVTEADWQGWKPEDMRPFLDVAFERFGCSAHDRFRLAGVHPGSYSLVMDVMKDYLSLCTTEVRDAVLGGNAQRFWSLKEGIGCFPRCKMKS